MDKTQILLKPERHETEIYANLNAKIKSIQNKDISFYVYYNQIGYFLIDTSAEIYAGEKLVSSYLNGEKI